jgi:probable rRNA maturation factor
MKHEPPSTGGLSVLIVNRQRKHRIKVERLRAILAKAARSIKVTGEVALVFAGDGLLHRLNRDYRFKDKPTDVLSFESQGEDMGLGDIFISVETARANAKRFSRTLDHELEILALHGFLHVLGYDHETDNGEMEAIERRLRARLLARADTSARADRATSRRVAA